MEMRAYVEGILRRWWLLALVVVLGWFVGGQISNAMTAQYSATASVLINDKILTGTAFSSGIVQLNLPATYYGDLTSPATFNIISKTYPRLTQKQLAKNVIVSTDATGQVLLIQVTDVSPFAVADIANYLAQRFVRIQTASLQKQLDFYQQWLQTNVTQLNDQVNTLNRQIDTLSPTQSTTATLTPTQRKTLSELLFQRNQDSHTLYTYQQALTEVQQAQPLMPKIYTILRPASEPQFPNTSPTGTTTIRLLTILGGLTLLIIIFVANDFFTPTIRHRNELPRIVGVPVLAEAPQFRPSEQKRLLQLRHIPFMSRLKPIRLLCASISAMAIKQKGLALLLTTPTRKRRFTPLVGMFLANKGHRVLLVDADFVEPTLHEQLQTSGPANLQLPNGRPLPFIVRTPQSNLFLLPATATLAQNQPLDEALLLELLPELKTLFDIILIDAAPFDQSSTHMLATKIEQVMLFVKKRRDHLSEVRTTCAVCNLLKLKPYYVLLS